MERFAAINDRYVSFLKSEISMHLFCYPGFTCGAVGRCNNSTNPIRYSNCCSSSRLSVGLFSRESSFTGTCTPSGASASYSSTAGSTISTVRLHSFVPSTFTAAWVCFARNRVSGFLSFRNFPLLLRLIKNQLQSPMQMYNLDIIHVLLPTIPGVPI